jgi:tRNA splicing endonuclease
MRIRQSIGNKSVYTHISTKHLFPVPCDTILEIPVTNDEKYKVFRDLWLKGFFISGGDSFGCDFLAYPGDPMFYHASQIVHVIARNQQLDPKYVISCVRLSVTVNKKCVFAYVDESNNVTYQTLHWDNPKLRQVYANSKAEKVTKE